MENDKQDSDKILFEKKIIDDEIVNFSEYNESYKDKFYRESIKNRLDRVSMNKFRKFICIVVICSIFGGFSLGIGISTGTYLINKYIVPISKSKDNVLLYGIDKNVYNQEFNFTMSKAIDIVKPSIANIMIDDDTLNFEKEMVGNKDINSNIAGTGIVFDEDDNNIYIVTNEHVIRKAKNIKVSFLKDIYVDGIVIGSDKTLDLAILYVEKSKINYVESIKVGKFCSEKDIKVGDFVIAIGNVFGQGYTSTVGIISAKDREINIGNNVVKVIQTDAAINPGNSGGPLVNLRGEIIGINTLKISKSNVELVGYAVSSDIFLPIIKDLRNGLCNFYFGIRGFDMTESMSKFLDVNIRGIFIESVLENSMASKLGIKENDIIISFNGNKIYDMEQFKSYLNEVNLNDNMELEIIRDNYKKVILKIKS